jgi:hypothetical protein
MDTALMAALTREQIDAEHYVGRYARGTLSEQEAEQFEEFCLLHPELVQDVLADRVMRRGLKSIDVRGADDNRRIVWRNLAIAASVLAFALVIGWQFWTAASSTGPLFASSSPHLPAEIRGSIAGPFAIVRERRAGVQTLKIPAGAAAVEVTLEPLSSAGAARYLVSLEEFDDDRWVPRGQIELAPPSGSAAKGIPVVIDLREVRGPRLRLTLSGMDGATDAFELHLE